MNTQSKTPTPVSIDKEVLEISPTPWFIRKNGYEVIMDKDDLYSVAVANTSFRPKKINANNAKAICTAVNETYGKGYNPASLEELYNALDRVVGFLADLNGSEWIKGQDVGSLDMKQRAKGLQSFAYKTLQNSKL